VKIHFGRWTFNESNLTLTHSSGYEIDLERNPRASMLLDWILQIRMHARSGGYSFNKGDVIELIDAFVALLNPQGILCCFGNDGGKISDVRSRISAVLAQSAKRRREEEGVES
jgi:hypothetical protein